MNLVLVFLQPNKPPNAQAHENESNDASQNNARQEGALITTSQRDKNASPGGHDKRNC